MRLNFKGLGVWFFSFSVFVCAQRIQTNAATDSYSSVKKVLTESLPQTHLATKESKIYEKNSPAKQAGQPSILICRPVHTQGSQEDKTMYIAAISEGYLHLKLSAINGYRVIPQEKLASNIPHFKDFSMPISRDTYNEHARLLNASYLVYLEYETTGVLVNCSIELYSIFSNQKVLALNYSLDPQDLETGLEICVGAIVNALSIDLSTNISEFLTTATLVKNQKILKDFGNALAAVGNFPQSKVVEVISQFERIIKMNPKFYLAKYVTASLCAHAGEYDKAIKYQNELISSSGRTIPSFYLGLASYHKYAGNFTEAIDAVAMASKDPSFNVLVTTERAGIYEAKGDLEKAKDEYEKLFIESNIDGSIALRLALVYIGLNDLTTASHYLTLATGMGYVLDKDDYFELGMRYSAIDTTSEQAIEAFKNCLNLQQENENAWLELSKLYTKLNRKSELAECLVSLYKINNTLYKDELLKASAIYEELNETGKSKVLYALYLISNFSNFQVRLKLAKLEAQDGNCEKATELVYNLDTISSITADVQAINLLCEKTEPSHAAIQAGNAYQNKSPGAGFWRIISGIVTLGAAGAGYYFDTQIESKQNDYKKSRNVREIDRLHNDLKTYQALRNVFYAGAGLSCAGFVLSITLPIVVSK